MSNAIDLRTVLEWWPAVVIGWPAVGIAFAAFAAGLLGRRAWLILVGALVSAPFCLYVSLYPRIGLVGVIVLSLNLVAVWASRRGRYLLAAVSVLPFVGLAAFMASLVLSQSR